MEKDKVLHLLGNADWKDIILRLTYYAHQRAKIYSWKSRKLDQLLGGKTLEDIACEAIEKVLSGKRDWDPNKYPNLLTHLQWVVKSDMEHLASSMEYQVTERSPENGDEKEIYEIIPDPSLQTPEDQLIAREQEILEERRKGELYDIVKGDEDLEMLLLCFEEGIDKPEKIAAQTGWDISKVYNLKKRFLRKATKLSVHPQERG